MKFEIKKGVPLRNFTIVYDGCYFYIDPPINIHTYSIEINELLLEFDEKGDVLFLQGYCPPNLWKETSRIPSNFEQNILHVSLEKEIIPGVSIKLNETRWPVYINKKNGWICIGSPFASGEGVEFAQNCIAIIDQANLKALWLHPIVLQES